MTLKNKQKELSASIQLCHSSIGNLKRMLNDQSDKINKCEDELDLIKNENMRLKREISYL